MFADFGELPFEKQIEFYQHQQNWSNRMILGDSLLVMTSLAEKEGLKGQVQMIYIDPPYGIKFGSNWQVSTRKRDVKDGKAEDATRQPEQVKAFRDTWEKGIHSYLAYMRDRLVVARELLTESGSVFVQIGDENTHLIRCLLDEIFGSENFIAHIFYRLFGIRYSQYLDSVSDNILWYGKNRSTTKFNKLFLLKRINNDNDFEPVRLFRPGHSNTLNFCYRFQNHIYKCPTHLHWATSATGINLLNEANRLIGFKTDVRFKRYQNDFPCNNLTTNWSDTWGEQEKNYVVQTATKVIERCLLMTTDPGDLVLDPTCGSGTTADVAEQWGRRWITIDTSRVALALARTRLMAARYPYYLLSDSPEGKIKEMELNPHFFTIEEKQATLSSPPGRGAGGEGKTRNDVRRGFVYKRVPHITLKIIAHNEEIDEIYSRWGEELDPLRAELNKVLDQSWEEWEIPHETDEGWPEKAQQLHTEWWKKCRQRQQEIDESIARSAPHELLYDQPYEDRKKIRVSGPFTVESLSPHRMLSAGEQRPASEQAGQQDASSGQFETMILDNLRSAGVQNTVKNERLKFDRLETYAGAWVHAEGEYTEADGQVRSVAVSIGPEHGTVGPQLIKKAAKEAVQGVGFDVLVVCGFAFDPHVSEEAKRYGSLIVLPTHMNPDLAMGDELLKKTGTGNLFMVFGEPDLDLHRQEDGRLVVELKGVDVYDPTTGVVRSNTTDEVACWFIDTDYNEESFFVRHAYFTGAGEPYKKLQRALRAEINVDAWSALYSPTATPLTRPRAARSLSRSSTITVMKC